MEESLASSATKAGIGYTVANILIKGIGFLTLPIFSRLLDTHDFGIYNVFLAYDAILFCVIGFALHSSVKSANWEFPGKIDRYISSISLIYLANMVILIVLVLTIGAPLEDLLGLETVVIVAMVLHSFGQAIVTLYNARISLQYSYGKYMAVAAATSLGNIALSLLLIFTVFTNQRYLGRILGATVALLAVGLILVALFWRKARPHVSKTYWKFGMRYSLPIVAHGLSQVLLAQIGRLMTNYMVSTAAAGVYGLAANLSSIIAVLAESVSTVWSTWFYETMEGESAGGATEQKDLTAGELDTRGAVIRKRADQLATLFAIVTIALMAIAPEMIWVLGGDAFMEGAYCAFGIILSGYCVILYNLICVGEYYKQKTGYIMVGTIAAAVINIILNFWGISTFGYIAAAYTTLVAYVFYVAFHWFISRKLIGFPVLSGARTIALGSVLIICMGCDIALMGLLIPRLVVGLAVSLAAMVFLVHSVGGFKGIIRLVKR